MHEVEGQQPAAQGGQRCAAGHPLAEHIHDWAHGDAEQGAHDTPAEGIHAEDQNAQSDEQLAQRGVGIFVAVQAVQQLVGAAGVVDFVEIHPVAEAQPPGQGLLLVEKTGVEFDVFRQNAAAVFVHEHQLLHRHLPVKAQRDDQLVPLQIPLGQGYGLPGEDLAKADLLLVKVVLQIVQRGITHRHRRILPGIRLRAVKPAHGRGRFGKDEAVAAVWAEGHGVFRRDAAAEIMEGKQAVEHRDGAQKQPVQP